MTNAGFSGTHRLSRGSAVINKTNRSPQLHKDTNRPKPFLSLHFQAVDGTNTNTSSCLYGILQFQRHSPNPKSLSVPIHPQTPRAQPHPLHHRSAGGGGAGPVRASAGQGPVLPWGVHVLWEAFLHKQSAGQKCGQRAKGSVFRFCLLCLTALVIVKVNDIIPLCTVMKQLSEDSISQAVYVADELLQMCRARRVTQLMLPWSESTRRPATFSAPGRGQRA